MASKQQRREAQEQLADLRLRAAISSTNYEVTGEGNFFKSNDSGAGDQALWTKLKNEEAAEIEN